MIKFLKQRKQDRKLRFVERGLYFIRNGDNQGAFVVNIKEEDSTNSKALLIMPVLERASISKDLVSECFNSGMLEYVSTLPKKVYAVCLAQYKALK